MPESKEELESIVLISLVTLPKKDSDCDSSIAPAPECTKALDCGHYRVVI